ncbi:MAG TPA: hypothetical protein VH743_11115 [Beijerinckiaceae bacterium]
MGVELGTNASNIIDGTARSDNAIGGNNTVTFIADAAASNQEIQFGFGTNILNLAGADDDLALIIGGNVTVQDATDSGNLSLTLLNQQLGSAFDFGDGSSDTLQLFTPESGTNDVTVTGVEHVLGSSAFDSIHVAGNSNITEVVAGVGSDWIYASGSIEHIRFTSLQDSYSSAEERDVIYGFTAGEDLFVFTDGAAEAMVSAIHLIGSAAFSDTGQTEARLVDLGDGFQLVEIDADGDGEIGANDMTIELFGLTGTLTDGDFLIA